MARLKAEPGRELLVIGSSSLAQTLIEHNLVDEFRLMIHPVVLGGGKKLFRGSVAARPMQLIEARTSVTGLVLVTYRPGATSAPGA